MPTAHRTQPVRFQLTLWPLVQPRHTVAPELLLCRFSSHFVQLTHEVAQYAPAGHGVQLMPAYSLPVKEPAPQVMHTVLPVSGWYAPAEQNSQSCPMTVATLFVYMPALQATHASLVGVLLSATRRKPASHSALGAERPLVGHRSPLACTHAMGAEEPAGQYEPMGHCSAVSLRAFWQ